MNLERALAEWAAALGDAAVVVDRQALARYENCTSGATRRVPAALRPQSAASVAQVVRIAARHGIPLHAISSGHNWGYGTALGVAAEPVLVDLSGMCAIHSFDAELGVVSVEPGVTQGDLARYLAERDAPYLVPVTGGGPSCSLVGNALERGYGITPICDHASAVMSLEAVLSDGTVLRPVLAELGAPGTATVFRWGIGPYLNGLFLQGAAGIVTSMTLALARRPETMKAFVAVVRDGAAVEALAAAVRRLLADYPGVVGAINVMNARRILAMSVPYPAKELGRDGVVRDEVIDRLRRERDVGEWTLYGTLYGKAAVVAAAQAGIKRSLKPFARRLLFVSRRTANALSFLASHLPGALGRRIAPAAKTLASSLELVEGRPNETALPLAYWAGASGPPQGTALDPARDGCGLIWYSPLIPMRAEAVRDFLDFVVPTMRRHGIEPLVTLTTVSDRCFDSSVPLLFDRRSPAAVERAQACYMDLLETGRQRGFMPYRVHVDAMRWLTSHPSGHWDLVDRLKAALDPQNLFEPGRYCRPRAS